MILKRKGEQIGPGSHSYLPSRAPPPRRSAWPLPKLIAVERARRCMMGLWSETPCWLQPTPPTNPEPVLGCPCLDWIEETQLS